MTSALSPGHSVVNAKVPRVALVMVTVGDLAGSGGAERHFSDLHAYFRELGIDSVTLLTARLSLERLRAAGRLSSAGGVVTLPLSEPLMRGRIGVVWMTMTLLWATLRHRFDVVHICLPTPSYVPFAALVTRLPKFVRPRVALNVIDCTLAHNLRAGTPADLYERQVVDAHRLYFRWASLDGIYSWYSAFVDVSRNARLVAADTLLRAARFCFTDPAKFRPAVEKQRLVVFAGRLSEQKRPLVFVDAVAVLRERQPELIDGWRFEMYGSGVLEPQVRERIETRGLANILSINRTLDMSPVFAQSRLYVSTQALENFTSLAMLEAMAAGNAVVAEDVGQTCEFVRHGENGILVSPGTPDAFAEGIATYLRRESRHDDMARASRRLATDVHTIDNCAADITAFWRDLVARSA